MTVIQSLPFCILKGTDHALRNFLIPNYTKCPLTFDLNGQGDWSPHKISLNKFGLATKSAGLCPPPFSIYLISFDRGLDLPPTTNQNKVEKPKF